MPTPTPTPRPATTGYVSPADYLETCIANFRDDGDINETITAKEVVEWLNVIRDEMRSAET